MARIEFSDLPLSIVIGFAIDEVFIAAWHALCLLYWQAWIAIQSKLRRSSVRFY